MSTSRRFTPSDSAWLHMDRPDNPMVVNGVFELDGALSLPDAQRIIGRRLLQHRRFRERVRFADSGHPTWEQDPDFSLDNHVSARDGGGDSDAVHRAIDDLASEHLPLERPLWHIYVFARTGGRTIVLCRVHHCIADGIALMRVLLSISDEHAETSADPGRAGAHAWYRGLGRNVWAAVRRPRRILAEALGYAEVSARLVLRRPDPSTSLRGKLGSRKRTAWSRPMSLAMIKRVGKAQGATINDVLTAAVAGALRRYLSEHGGASRSVRATVPVNLRPLKGPIRLGNRFGLVLLELPILEPDPLSRLREAKRRMDFVKGAREAVVGYVFLEALGLLTRRLEAPFIRFFGDKASVVLTNVPGPRERLHLDGHEIRRMMFWVPQSGGLAVGISIVSYAGEVVVGVMSDDAVVRDPMAIAEAYEAEIAALEDAVLGPSSGAKAAS